MDKIDCRRSYRKSYTRINNRRLRSDDEGITTAVRDKKSSETRRSINRRNNRN